MFNVDERAFVKKITFAVSLSVCSAVNVASVDLDLYPIPRGLVYQGKQFCCAFLV